MYDGGNSEVKDQKEEEAKKVTVIVDQKTAKHPNPKGMKNSIRTSKYTLLTFVPFNLLVQFSKAANIYFLIITYLQTIELISISDGKPAMAVPLIFIILVTMVKDGFEDYQKAKQDTKENDTPIRLFDRQTQ